MERLVTWMVVVRVVRMVMSGVWGHGVGYAYG